MSTEEEIVKGMQDYKRKRVRGKQFPAVTGQHYKPNIAPEENPCLES